MRRIVLFTLLLSALLLLPAVGRAQDIATSARACAVIDAESGRLLLSHNAQERLPMASTTKVMTALLALERGNLNDRVVTGRNAFGVPGTSIYLDLGESLSLEEMLYGLMLASGNDAAVAIAEHIGGTVDEFARMMTDRARELGCTDTVFLTPHGLPADGHFTTARDLALIAREAMTHPMFREIVSTRRAVIPWSGHEWDRVLNNKHRLLADYDGATGIKTGYTRAAGRCLVFGAARDGMEIIGVVLNCANWFDEAARLMDQAFDQYERCTLLCRGDCVRCIPVTDGFPGQVQAVLAQDLSGIVPKNRLPQLTLELPEKVDPPVTVGQVLGTARLILDGECLGETDIVALQNAAADTFAAHWHACWDHWMLSGT